MSPIRTPRKRAYYPTSPNEKDRLLLWIPKDELEGMVQEDLLPPSVLEDFPRGMEVEVSPAGFEELGIDVGISPEAISATYGLLAETGKVSKSGLADGAALEGVARGIADTDDTPGPPRFTLEALDRVSPPTDRGVPEPEMADGEEAQTFLRRL